MKFFNVDGTVKRENNENNIFGWIWNDLYEDRWLKMTLYNSDGSIRSEEYYDEFNDWEIVADIEEQKLKEKANVETVNSIKWYQRTFSSVVEENKTKLSNLLINLDNKESHLLLSIVNSATFNSLATTKLRKTDTTHESPIYSDINNDVSKTIRLKKLHQSFNIDFNFELLKTRYNSTNANNSMQEVNKYIEDYLEVVDGLKQILFWDFYLQPKHGELDEGPKGIRLDKSSEPNADIDQTLLKLFDKTCEMHCEVEKIRKCFLEYEHKIELLLRTCKNIQEDIFETKFLDDVILSLNDKIEKLNHTWPFKIGKSKSGSISNNLIV